MKTFEFTKLDRQQIEKDINLKAKAEEDGQFKRPSASSKERSICEAEGVDRIRDHVDINIERANRYLAPITNRIDEIRIIIKETHYYIQKVRNKIDEILEQAKSEFQTQRLIYDHEEKDVETFKKLNGFNRQPKSLTFQLIIFQIGIIIGLFVIESFANMQLLAEAIGEQEGYAYSMAVAALNVLLSALVGYFILKGALNYQRSTKKNLLILAMTLYGIFIFYINICLGAFRAIALNKDAGPQSIVELTVSQEYGLNPLYFWEVHWGLLSLVLTFIGITFAIISLIDAYFYNDVFPGYGTAAKKMSEASEKITRTDENLANNTQKVFNQEHIQGGHKLKGLHDKELKELVNSSNQVTQVFDGYNNYIHERERDINHIFEEYRRFNEGIRTDGVRPAYWDIPFTFTEGVKKPEAVFKNSKAYYYEGSTIQDEIAAEQKRLTDEQNQYEKGLNQLKEETDQKILELRKTYAFS